MYLNQGQYFLSLIWGGAGGTQSDSHTAEMASSFEQISQKAEFLLLRETYNK